MSVTKPSGSIHQLEESDGGVAPTNKEDKVQVDTVHNDEAIKVLAHYSGDSEWEEKEEKKLARKIDWRLMPVLCAT